MRIDGTMRYFDRQEVDKALDLIENVGSQVANAHGCKFIVNTLEAEYDPVINDSDLSRIMKEELRDYFGENLKEGIKWYASESFELYGKLAPALFSLVGIANDDKGSGAEHHTQLFDLDEDALENAVFAMVKFAIRFL